MFRFGMATSLVLLPYTYTFLGLFVLLGHLFISVALIIGINYELLLRSVSLSNVFLLTLT